MVREEKLDQGETAFDRVTRDPDRCEVRGFAATGKKKRRYELATLLE